MSRVSIKFTNKNGTIYAEVNGKVVKFFKKVNGVDLYSDEFIEAYVYALNLPLVETLKRIDDVKSGRSNIILTPKR